jgi:hypothetical protein
MKLYLFIRTFRNKRKILKEYLSWKIIVQVLSTMKLGYNEHAVITNRFLSQIGYFKTQINPVITNKNSWPRAVRYK